MTAGFRFCKRSVTGALAVGVLAFGVTVQGQDFNIQGVPNGGGQGNIGQTSSDCTVDGDTITCPGGNRIVHFSIHMRGWADDGSVFCHGGDNPGIACTDDTQCTGSPSDGYCGGRELGTWQATMDGASYDNGSGVLNPINFPGGDLSVGGYQVTATCFGGTSDGLACGGAGVGPFGIGLPGVQEGCLPSGCGPAGTCTGDGGLFCVGNGNFIHACCDAIAAVSVASINYSYGSTTGTGASAGRPDDGTNWYGGDLVLEIPAGASGTWEIVFLTAPDLTFMSDYGAGAIGVNCATDEDDCLVLLTGKVIIPVGTCCRGAPITCNNDFTKDECGASEWQEGRICEEPIVADNPNDCTLCLVDIDCDDGDACTDDTCDAGCNNVPNYDTGTDCCDPATGVPTPIDDGIECTDCACLDGFPDCVTSADGDSCDDSAPCTGGDDSDTCSGGVCSGPNIFEIACVDDGPCKSPSPGCDLDPLSPDYLFCICKADVVICVNPTGGERYPDPNCFNPGDNIDYTVQIGTSTSAITGAQVNMSYDPDCMTFVGAGTCDGSIFDTVIDVDVDENAGTIFIAVIVDPTNPVGTIIGADVACLSFTKNDDCDECTVCLEDENPRHTILANKNGNRASLDACDCGKSIRANGDITLNAPPGESVNVDCDSTTADVTWDMVSASDSCDGPLTVDCDSAHAAGDPTAEVLTGGVHVQGKHYYMCEATNTCGDNVKKVWTVDVSSNQALDVVVHLSPKMDDGVFCRAITFNLYNDDQCWSAPLEECAEICFNGPYNFAGHGSGTLKVGKGQYTCITAQDCLHTLRGAASINCADGRWSAVFKGANWLLGGNLDCWKADDPGDKNCINIVDFSMFMVEIADGADYANGNTDCETAGPHGDINADGNVDTADYGFILENFLECSKDLCCDDGARAGDNLTTEISVKELRRRGMGDLAVADLNGDGWVNMDDMTAYMQGVRPVEQRIKRTSR